MDNKKNILFLGTTNYGFELSNSDKNKFKELNSMLNVFVFTYGKLAREIDFENVKIKYLKEPKQLLTKYLKFYFFSIFTLMNFINSNNISIVSAKEPISALNPVLIKLIFKKDIKIIIENHGDYRIQLLQQRDSYIFSKTIFLTKYINKFVFNHADMLRGVSKQNSKAFKIYNPNLRNYNFPAWIDNSIFKYNNVERSNDILFVGNIIKRKGIEFLIRSLSPFLIENKDVVFRIVGKKEDAKYFQSLKKIIEKNNLDDQILFLDELNQNDISILMNKSKILVMGSTSEGLPRVLIEAGFCKLPSVATDIDGIYNPFFTNGGTLTYKLNSENDFMNSFNKLNSDEGLWKIQSEKSYKLSNEIAGNGRFVNNWLKIITMINSEL